MTRKQVSIIYRAYKEEKIVATKEQMNILYGIVEKNEIFVEYSDRAFMRDLNGMVSWVIDAIISNTDCQDKYNAMMLYITDEKNKIHVKCYYKK